VYAVPGKKSPIIGGPKASILRESAVVVCKGFDVVETDMCGQGHDVRVRHGGLPSPDDILEPAAETMKVCFRIQVPAVIPPHVEGDGRQGMRDAGTNGVPEKGEPRSTGLRALCHQGERRS